MIHDYLTNISKASLAVWLVTLIITTLLRYIFSPPQVEKSSFEPVLFLACFLSILHIGWELYVGSLFNNPELKDLVRAMWYLGFGLSDWAFLLASLWMIKKLSLAKSYGTNAILIAFTVMGVLQVARYCDRYIMETDYLRYIYTNGIPSINSIITIIIAWHALVTCHELMKSAREAS